VNRNGDNHGGARPNSGRPAGLQNRIVEAVKRKSLSFFERILDDETEAKFWRYFMTGYVEDRVLDDVGNTVSYQIIKIPLEPIAFQAFKRAVEYKRGMPVQAIIAAGDLKVQVEYIGA